MGRSVDDIFDGIEKELEAEASDEDIRTTNNEEENGFYFEESFHDNAGKETSRVSQFLPTKTIEEAEYLSIMRSLNHKQRKFVLHVLHCFKTGKKFYHFLTGGAGVGKSQVITAIVQSILRYCNSLPGFHPDYLPVLVTIIYQCFRGINIFKTCISQSGEYKCSV